MRPTKTYHANQYPATKTMYARLKFTSLFGALTSIEIRATRLWSSHAWIFRRLGRMLFVLSFPCATLLASEKSPSPLLLHSPSVSNSLVAFSYAGCIWTARRDGTQLRHLTNGGHEYRPFFSPDGSLIAYTGNYGGTRNIYVISKEGGTPRQLTFHPGDIDAAGWTPDGKEVLFTSSRSGFAPKVDENTQLFTVPVAGGFATPVPLKRVSEGSYSPDKTLIAYVPNVRWGYVPYVEWRDSMMDTWKHYRGGQTTPIFIAKLSDATVIDSIPRDNSNDFDPMWVGDTVYFLSDRNGPVSLFGYDLATRRVREVIRSNGGDIKSAAADSDAIVYEQLGSIHIFDLRSGTDAPVDVRPNFLPSEALPHLENIKPQQISAAKLDRTGNKVIFGARGEIFTSTLSGDSAISDITNTSDAVEREPTWSPDGRSIAYLSDASGEYMLHLRNAEGYGTVRQISLGTPSTYYYSLAWSPDSSKLGYIDKKLNYWYMDLKTHAAVRIDTDIFPPQLIPMQFSWSPDSRWVAYTKQLPSHVHAVYLYSLDRKKNYQITDGMSDVAHVDFDKSGRYLYFTASTDLFSASNDWSNVRRPVERNVYKVILNHKPSRLRSIGIDDSPTQGLDDGVSTDMDLDGITHRIIPLRAPSGNYVDLRPGEPGVLFLAEAPLTASSSMVSESGDGALKIHRIDLKLERSEEIPDKVTKFDVSFDGTKILYASGDRWFIKAVSRKALISENPSLEIKLDSMRAYVDPRAEWRHIFEQVLRNERDFFLDPELHGINLSLIRKKYEAFSPNISSREELTFILEDMLGEFATGHMFIRIGTAPEPLATKIGLLGADYSIVNDRYKITKIYGSDTWNPTLRGPLDSPGVYVETGEYILGIDGRDIRPPADIYSFFVGTAGKPVRIKVGPNADGTGSREIAVTPIDNELNLRNFAWVESNRRKVKELSDDRVAYIYLPDTASSGYAEFNRYYFAQSDKDAVIIDDRFNHGGGLAEYFIDYLRRPLFGYWHTRDTQDFKVPLEGIFGPKVMLVNEMSGSGGEMLPWLFQKLGVGPLIGKRTWGGLVTSGMFPDDLLDGTLVMTPNQALYNLQGEWEIENQGIRPDIEISDSLKMEEDPQLLKAVEVVTSLLKRNPPPTVQRPPFPNYHANDGPAESTSGGKRAASGREN